MNTTFRVSNSKKEQSRAHYAPVITKTSLHSQLFALPVSKHQCNMYYIQYNKGFLQRLNYKKGLLHSHDYISGHAIFKTSWMFDTSVFPRSFPRLCPDVPLRNIARYFTASGVSNISRQLGCTIIYRKPCNQHFSESFFVWAHSNGQLLVSREHYQATMSQGTGSNPGRGSRIKVSQCTLWNFIDKNVWLLTLTYLCSLASYMERTWWLGVARSTWNHFRSNKNACIFFSS